MVIYGVGILAACVLAGRLGGGLIGWALGIDADVGGVGVAMLLLMASTAWLRRVGRLHAATAQGIGFWSDVYVPVVVAMAASQNVQLAVLSGSIAVFSGAAAVASGMVLVPLVARVEAGASAEPSATRK